MPLLQRTGLTKSSCPVLGLPLRPYKEKSVAAVLWGACNTDRPPVNLDGAGLFSWTLSSPYWGINTEMGTGSLSRAVWFYTLLIS